MKLLASAKLAVMGELKIASKDKRMVGNAGNYAYTSIAGLLDDIRPVLIKHELTLVPASFKVASVGHVQIGQKQWQHLVIVGRFRLTHSSGESEILSAVGEAMDGGDKSANKAQTAALKNVLLKAFLLQGENDDPDDDMPQDDEARSSQGSKRQPQAKSRTADPVASVPPNGGVDMKQVQDAYEKEICAAYEQLPLTSDWTAIHNAFWPIVDRRIKGVCKDAASYKPAATRAKKWASLAWINGVCKTAKTLADLGIAETKLDFLAGHRIDDELVPEKWIATVRDRIEKRKKELSSAGEADAMQRFVRLLDIGIIEMNDTYFVAVFDKAFADLPADKKSAAFPICKSLWLLRLIPMVADAHDDQFVQERINKLKGKLASDAHAALEQAMQAKRIANKARPTGVTP